VKTHKSEIERTSGKSKEVNLYFLTDVKAKCKLLSDLGVSDVVYAILKEDVSF